MDEYALNCGEHPSFWTWQGVESFALATSLRANVELDYS